MYWKREFYFFLKCYYCLLHTEACSSSGNGMPEKNFPTAFPIIELVLSPLQNEMLVQAPASIVAVRAIWDWKDDFHHKFTEWRKSKRNKKRFCATNEIKLFMLYYRFFRFYCHEDTCFVARIFFLPTEQYFRQHKFSIYDEHDNGKIIESDKKIYCVTTFSSHVASRKNCEDSTSFFFMTWDNRGSPDGRNKAEVED